MNNLKHLLALFCLTLFSQILFAQVYSEDFSGQDGKGVVGSSGSVAVFDTTGMDWTVDVSSSDLSASTDYFKVNTVSSNEIFEARDTDGEVVWKSPSVDISSSGLVDLSIDLSEVGTMEAGDYIKVYYILNGGSEVLFLSLIHI